MKLIHTIAGIVIAVFLLSSCLAAQSTGATIMGRVLDPTKAAVFKALVEATDVETGVTYKTESNDSGLFTLPNLSPATYRVSVAKQGFRSIVKPDVVLHVQDVVALNFDLAIGSTSEVVTVSGGAPLVDTESAAVSTVVDREFVENMPLNGRSFQGLIELVPGVVATGATGNNPGQFSINGQRSDTNGFSIDGVSANAGVNSSGSIGGQGAGTVTNTAATGGFNSLVSVDALQEFRIETSTFAPEYGRTPGGQIAIVTRSGTNQFHGTAYDYLRNNYFDAKDWFSDHQNLPQAPLRQNDFGGTLGGPIIKDKLFFFASYEGLRLTQSFPTASSDEVPSLCARGDAPCIGGAVAANVNIQPYFKAMPLPTGPSVGGPNDPDFMLAPFSANLPSTSQLDAGSIRADFSINSKMTLFGRYNDSPTQAAAVNFIGANQPTVVNTRTLTIGHTWTVTNRMANDLRFNYSHTEAGSSTVFSNFGGAVPAPSALEFPNSSFGASDNAGVFLNWGFPLLYFPGQTASNKQRQLQAIDTFSYVKAAHQLKFGFDWRQLTPVFLGTPYTLRASYVVPQALVEKQIVNGTFDHIEVDTEPGQTYRFYNYSVFAQDTWKIASRLTLAYGLRWDINPAPGSPNGTPSYSLTHFDPTSPATLALTTAAPFVNSAGTQISVPPPYNTQWSAVAPRLGFAYQLSADPRWQRVLRGGFGMFYDTGNDVSGLLFGPYTTQRSSTVPFGYVFPLANNNNCGNIPSPGAPANCLSPIPVSLTPPFFAHTQTTAPNLSLPYVYQFNAAVEQAVGTSQSVTLTYVGAIGRSLLRTQTLTLTGAAAGIFPSGLTVFDNGGTSDYHALQADYQRRLSHGLQVLASYTWAHSIDTASAYTNGASGGGSASVNPAQDRGPSDFDIRDAVHAGVSYDFPVSSKENGFARAILGGWGLDSIYQFRTAPPFDLTEQATFDPTTGINLIDRPNYNGGPIWLYDGNPADAAICGGACPGGRVLNVSAFSAPPTGQQGNFPRNALRAFGLSQLDMTVRRDFALTEKFHLQFRADVFNILNHPNFAPPTGQVFRGASAGESSGSLATFLGGGGHAGFNPLYNLGASRSMQFSLKLKF